MELLANTYDPSLPRKINAITPDNLAIFRAIKKSRKRGRPYKKPEETVEEKTQQIQPREPSDQESEPEKEQTLKESQKREQLERERLTKEAAQKDIRRLFTLYVQTIRAGKTTTDADLIRIAGWGWKRLKTLLWE